MNKNTERAWPAKPRRRAGSDDETSHQKRAHSVRIWLSAEDHERWEQMRRHLGARSLAEVGRRVFEEAC